MSLRFRNLDFDPREPIDAWPAEAIETVIDRGTLSDWRRLAEEAGTSASRLSAYENAKVAPTTDVLARFGHVAALHAASSSARR